jgi:hypothetical protein
MSAAAAKVKPKRGTLHLFCHLLSARPTSPWVDVSTLVMRDQPEGCYLQSRDMEDMELGDSECKPVPNLPKESGLWVLVWPWHQIRHYDAGWDVFDCKYGKGAWRRLTTAELTWLANGSEGAP